MRKTVIGQTHCHGDGDKVKTLDNFEKEYDQAYEKLCLPLEWREACQEIENKPCFVPKKKESLFRGSLQRTMWIDITDKYGIPANQFPDYKSFLKHAEKYDKDGHPKNPPVIKFRNVNA